MTLAPSFRRFWRAWLAFACSAAFGATALTIAYWVVEAVAPSSGDDMPPILVILLAGSALCPALVGGLVIVPFRHLVVQPRFPFLRWGYLAVATLPFSFALIARDAWYWPLLNPIDAEIWLLMTMLTFVVFGRWFGVLETDKSPRPSEAVRF